MRSIRKQAPALFVTGLFAVTASALLGALPLWLDEILQLIETRTSSTAEMIAHLPRNSGAVPIGYLVQHYALAITGYSVAKARLPAAIFGIGAVFAVALLAAELGVRYSWLAAAIFAVLPETLRYATESRVYSQALFFSVLATLIYVVLARRPSPLLATWYWLVLTLAIYTQPLSACVGLAHLVWSATSRKIRTTMLGGIAFALTVLAFLPWFLWAKSAWAAGIAHEGFRFSFSFKTVLMVFRETAGAGYWGSALLFILCWVAVATQWPPPRSQRLLLLLVVVPVLGVFATDALAGYFVAARQFIWVMPAVAILAAMAIERRARTAAVLYALLGVVCLRQSILYFTAAHENWQAASAVIVSQVQRGACLDVVPSGQARLYEFFYPELERAHCPAERAVLAITPGATKEQREAAIANLLGRGYTRQQETLVGKSAILLFQHAP